MSDKKGGSAGGAGGKRAAASGGGGATTAEPGSQAAQLAEIKAKLEWEYGFKSVRVEGDPAQVRAVVDMLAEAKKAGLPMPESFAISRDLVLKALPQDTAPAYYSPGKRAIIVDPTKISGVNAVNPAAEHAAGRWSTGDMGHVLRHEIGHMLHHRNLGENYYDEKVRQRPSARSAATARKVSRYARRNRAEFVAETYAGLAAGKKYPADVMSLYRRYGGHIPRG